MEGPAGKDCCWKNLGMKVWVPPPPSLEEPQLASGWFALEKRLSC